MLSTPVLLTGFRPTGPLHLGHWAGTLRESLCQKPGVECIFLIADLHALTTQRPSSIDDLLLDLLSVGVGPTSGTFVLQSQIPEIAELAVLLSMLCPVAEARRIPTVKEKVRDLKLGQTFSLGLLNYPVLMAADILIFHASKVAVGADQVAHVELARRLARRFNQLYEVTLWEPDALLSSTPRLVGLDGSRKMSKSLDNAILLSDDPETVERRVASMYTDPKRIRADIPGTVEGNPLFEYHDLVNPDRAQVADMKARYRTGRIADVEVKHELARVINAFLDPVRARRREWEGRIEEARAFLRSGTAQARKDAWERLKRVLSQMGL